MAQKPRVIIAGAGPVGLSAAAVLTAQGVPCLVLEKRPELSRASKASTFHPPTLEIFEAFGITGPMLEKGIIADRIQYRDTSGAVLAEFDHALLKGETRFPHRLHLEQSAITPLLCARIEASGLGEVRFGTEVTALGEGESGAWAEVRNADGCTERIEADFLLAADGAGSSCRELLGLGLEGAYYPGGVLRLVVSDPLQDLMPGLGQISYVFAPDGRSVSLLQMPGCWRIIIRLEDGFDEAQVVRPDYWQPILDEFLPALPQPIGLITHDIYRARKMLADSHGTGRIFLIGDALHLTNTRGGMNMNCGIHDALAVGMAIAEALETGRPDLAEVAARERRRMAAEELLPRTDRNVSGGPDWLAEVQARAADPVAAAGMLRRTTMLDMAPPREGLRKPEMQR